MKTEASPSQRVVLHGQELAYRECEGSGPLLVLVHGVGSNSSTWDPVLPPLVAAGANVLTLDLPGHGSSSKERGDYSLCANFAVGPIAPGIHIGTSRDASGGYAPLMPAHDSMLFRVPEGVSDELAVFADPFAVSLHAITRHPPPPGGRILFAR